MALTEFNLVILILLIRDALSICSICCFMLRCLSMWTPKNLTVSAIFSRCPYIVIEVSLITFLCEKLIRWVLPGFNLILHLSHHVSIWFRYFCNLRLILRIPGACAQIAMSSANWERFTCASGGWGMSLTYQMNDIGERGLPWGTPWMGMIGSLSWSLIEITSFLWGRKLLIHLINFLFRPTDVNLKRKLSNQTWSKTFSTSRNIPIVGWSFQKPSLIVSKSLSKLSFVLLFFLKPFFYLLNFLLASAQLLRLSATAFSKNSRGS